MTAAWSVPARAARQVQRAGPVTIVGVVVAAAYLALVGRALDRWPFEQWMVLFLVPALLATGALGIWLVVRDDDNPLFRLILVGLAAKLGATFVRYFVTFSLYGYGDATRYDLAGTQIANDFWDGRMTFLDVVKLRQGTFFIEDLTGLIYTLIGPSRLGGFLVFSFVGFWGLVLFYRAALLGVPGLAQRRYALLVFFLPALTFWPSSIGKEAVMMLALGLSAFGASKILSPGRGGVIPLAAGLGLTYMVRPHVAFVVLMALAIGWLSRRRPSLPGRISFGPVGRLIGALVLAVGASFMLGQAIDRFLPVQEETTTISGAGDLLDRAESGTASGGSEITRQTPNSPLDYPNAVWSVLFRPTIFEATDAGNLLAAVETTAVLILLVLSWTRLKQLPRLVLEHPYLVFCLVYIAVFAFAWSSFANLGALVRQRVQVWPFVLLLLALPTVRHPVTSSAGLPTAPPRVGGRREPAHPGPRSQGSDTGPSELRHPVSERASSQASSRYHARI